MISLNVVRISASHTSGIHTLTSSVGTLVGN